MKIIQDSREQTPWTFPEWVTVQIQKLDAGDYALIDDPNFSIERKSCSDFLGTISTGWNRFCREIERMKLYVAKLVIVEGDIISFYYTELDGEIISPNHQNYRLSPKFITKRIAQLSLMGVSILFCHDAEISSAVAYKILEERNNDIKRKD